MAMHASTGHKKAGKGKIRRIEIEPGTKKGYVSKVHRHTPEGADKNMMMGYSDPEMTPHADKAAVLAHLDKILPGGSTMADSQDGQDDTPAGEKASGA